MRKLIVAVIMGFCVLLVMGGAAVTNAAADKIILSWSDYAPINDDRWSYYKQFMKRVTEETNGQVEFKVFPSEQLVKAIQQFDALMRGTIDLCGLTPVYYSGKIPLACLSSESRYFEPGDPAVLSSRTIKENDAVLSKYGIKFLGWSGELPPMCFVGPVLVKKPASVKGLKVRAPGKAALSVNRWGGIGVSIPNSEIYMALQRGVVDVGYQTIASVESQRLWEVTPAITFTLQGGSPTIVCMNSKKWESLPDNVKKAFEKVSREMPAWAYKHARDYVKITEEMLSKKFKKSYKQTEADTELFDAGMGYIWEPAVKQFGKPAQDWWNKLLAIAAENKKARAEGKPIRFFEE